MYSIRKQQGAALITGLILMVVLMLLSVSAIRATIMDEKMAGNARDADIAFQAAESALREAEQVLNSAALPAFSTTGAYLQSGFRSDDYWLSTHQWTNNSVEYASTLNNTSAKPRYVIEQTAAITTPGASLKLNPIEESGIYKITARANGTSSDTFIYLQTTYRR